MIRRHTLIFAALLASACSAPDTPTAPDRLTVEDFLGAPAAAGFEQALEPVSFAFPRDHGEHPRFRNEWWYITGNLDGPGGREFGYQFTLFRNALSPHAREHPSRWSTNQTYLAQIAVTDVEGGRFLSDERFSRGALGLAGVEHTPFRAWLEDWQVRATPDQCDGCFKVTLTTDTEEFGMRLQLASERPVVLHGDQGLSRKGSAEGNASYYYSYTRLESSGELRIGTARYPVRGMSWMDHEWSTSSLQEDHVGWDWFSLRLADDGDVMLFQLRHRDDPGRNFLYGTFVSEGGEVRTIDPGGIHIEATGSWTSPDSAVTYPSGWRIGIREPALELSLQPLLAAQEMNLSFRYWEGAVRVSGSRGGAPVSGRGYVELTGY